MKPNLLKKWKTRLRSRRPAKPRGVAILTVLAIIALMTVLVISFFNMAQTQAITAKGSVELQRVQNMKDTAINMVIAQMREATTQRNVVWVSGPGWIRTFSNNDTSQNKLYKLYSSPKPLISNIGQNESRKLISDVLDDIANDWDQRDDEFVDINRPIYSVSAGTTLANERSDLRRLTFPVVDPRRYNGDNDPQENTEGFSYDRTFQGKSIRGVDASKTQLAMPIRWIYVLEDGTLGYLNPQKEFTSLTEEGAGATRENPIVGRMAWWVDDESCKVNVNTASVPAIWDTPRTTSREDREYLGKRQPLSGEFQRYPGHPATTDLSAVFFPGRRWTPMPSLIPPGGEMLALDESDAELIWDLAPFISGIGSGTGERGTKSGTVERPAGKSVTTFDGDDHLYTNNEELYFKATPKSGNSQNAARDNLLARDRQGEFLRRLEQSGFFLTHKSHSPETTVSGYPRVAMAAMWHTTPSLVGSNAGGTLPAQVTPYDMTIATNCTIGRNPYYFLREDPNSRHYEIFNSDRYRNAQLVSYLKALSDIDVAGYPEFYGSFFNTLRKKYPEPYSATHRKLFEAGGNGSNGNNDDPNSIFDATDRTQILVNMVDYMRSTNMSPGTVAKSTQYDQGQGQAAGVCGCGKYGDESSYHAKAVDNVLKEAKLTPKGMGRLNGAAAIIMLVNSPGGKHADGSTYGTFAGLTGDPIMDAASNTLWNDQNGGERMIVEIGFTIAGFCPKHGWGPSYFQGGVGVGSDEGVNGGSPETPAPAAGTGKKYLLPIRAEVESLDGSGKTMVQLHAEGTGLSFGSNQLGTTGKTVPTKVIPYGGATGGRALAKGKIGIISPFVIPAKQTSGPENFNLVCGRQPGDLGNLRILIYDNGGGGSGNVIQAISVALPSDFGAGLTVNRNTRRLNEISAQWWSADSPQQFPDPTIGWRSLVLPHGDYRLVVNPLVVEADMFVAQSGGGLARKISFYESNLNPLMRIPAGAVYNNNVAMIKLPDILGMQSLKNPDMPMLPLPPVGQGDLARAVQTLSTGEITPTGKKWVSPTHPKVLAMASKDPARAPVFAWGRRDGPGSATSGGIAPYRGSSDPDETGDFDNGVAGAPDGPYMNQPDDGDLRSTTEPYFGNLTAATGKPAAATISPNMLIRSPIDFGSIPSGTQVRVPWQTLRFRPDRGMNDPAERMLQQNDVPPDGLPFANFCGPRDHLFLDMFWMPVVEPWSISEPFSTKGTINMNQQIFPFAYINRTTALHAVLRGERMMAISNDAAKRYKDPNNSDSSYRYFVNAKETVRQFTMRYEGKDAEGFEMPFNVFRSAAEICEMWLVPDKNPEDPNPDSNQWTLEWIIGNQNGQGFWADHKLTGDNSRERPYANLYPRLCVRSNVFKVHLISQTLQKAASTEPGIFNAAKDRVTAEWRGSAIIERSVDPNDSVLALNDYANPSKANSGQGVDPQALLGLPKIDEFYTYRVTEVKQVTE